MTKSLIFFGLKDLQVIVLFERSVFVWYDGILFSNAFKSVYCEAALSQASGLMLCLGLYVSSHQPVNTHVFATQICQDHQCPTALIYSGSDHHRPWVDT